MYINKAYAWEQRKLEEFLKERTERAEGDEELLSVTINKGVIRQLESDKKNNSSENKSNYKLVYKGDIPYNSMRMWQGAVGVSQFEGIVSPAYTVLIPTEEADGKFLMELFKKSSSLQIFTRWSQGLTSDTWNLKYPTLSKLSFFVPYIKEQNKIAKLLQELDDLITLHQRKYDALKSMKKTLLSKMFPKNGEDVPEIRFKEFTYAWEQRKLGSAINVRSGKDYKHLDEGEVPVYGTGGYMLSVSEALENTQDAIGIGRKGTIDKPFVLKAPFWTVDTLFYCIPKGNNSLVFLYPLFQSINWKLYDESKGVPSISKTAIEGVTINLTSKDEQYSIGEYFESVDNLITLHQRKLEELKNMKKTLLQQMFV